MSPRETLSKAPSTEPQAEMNDLPLYPLRFEPILKRLLWGGRRLGTVLGKPIGGGEDYAESWEISDHEHGVSQVAEGPLEGVTLRELMHDRAAELLGPGFAGRQQFPLLIKFIDAHQVLSVQVHPDDALGQILANDNGKTETWVVLHADPGSFIYAGLKPGVDRDAFALALDSGAVEPLLHRFEAKAGDCVFIPAGTVHAIGAGIVLAEVQQMSDTTFRVYDWGRVGADGKPRALHLDEAMKSIDFEAGPVAPWVATPEPVAGGTRERLSRCAYFALERLTLTGAGSVGQADRFTILIGLGGSAEIRNGGTSTRLEMGQTLLLPAAIGACTVIPDGEAPVAFLACTVP